MALSYKEIEAVLVGAVFSVIGTGFFFKGGALAPMLYGLLPWAAYVILRWLSQVIRNIKNLGPRSFVSYNGVFVLLLAIFVIHSYSLESQIGMLGRERFSVAKNVLPRIISGGEDAVDPLIEEFETQLSKVRNRDGSLETDAKFRVEFIAFCLGRIGGAKAFVFLTKVFEQNVQFENRRYLDWEMTVIFALSSAGGEAAVPILQERFYRMTPEESTNHGWMLIIASAHSGSSTGVSFALNHLDHILKAVSDSGSGDKTYPAAQVAHALVTRQTPAALRALPVNQAVLSVGVHLPVGDPRDLRAEFYRQQDPETLNPDELLSMWEQEHEDIRRHWMEQFQKPQ